MDSISTVNGGLMVHIPLVSYPQKGSLALSYSVYFNSFGFQDLAQCIAAEGPTGPIATIPLRAGCTNVVQLIPTGLQNFPLGPRLEADQQLLSGGTSQPIQIQSTEVPLDARFFVISPDGSEHALGQTSSGFQSFNDDGYLFVPSSPSQLTNGHIGLMENAYAGDQTILMASEPGIITDSDGLVHTSNTITDLDGNTISFQNEASAIFESVNNISTSPGGLPTTDSTGRVIPTLVTASTSGCPSIASAQYQPLVSAATWSVPGPGSSGSATYLFCFATVQLATHYVPGSGNFGVAVNGNRDYYKAVTMLQSIVLPNSTFWGFVYNSANPSVASSTGLGELTTLIYPTGGQVNYTYQTFGGFCNSARESGLVPASFLPYIPQVLSRTMLDAQGNVLGTWQYSYPSGQNGTDGYILSPTGSLTVNNFVADGTECGIIDAGNQVYEGSSGTPIKTTVTSYINQVLPQGWWPQSTTSRPSKVTTTLQNGSVSSVQTNYAPGLNFYTTICTDQWIDCSASVAGTTLPIGHAISKTYTDFNGSVLKQQTTGYEWQTNSAYLTANMLEIPATTSVLDGSGNLTAKTSYTYDESAYSPGGIRGHDTTTTRALLTTGVSPTTHTGWNTSGMKTYIIDADANAGIAGHANANGHTSDYVYSSNAALSCNGSLVTSTINALNQTVSGTYDCADGLLSSFTDANNQTTNVAWDSMRRLYTITYPTTTAGTPTTQFTYNDSKNTVIRTIAASPDPTQTLQVNFDGFGREIHRITTDPAGNDTVDTTYDPDGRVSSVSNPYRSTSDPTYGTTSYTYDALNRKTVVTQPDGNKLITCYDGISTTSGQANCVPNASSIASASWVDTTDETLRHWQHVSDALGRLRAVIEPGPATNTLSLQTNYTYNTLDDLVSVNQVGTASETPRVRSFTYDSLSRLLCASNPENAKNPCPVSASTTLPANVVSYSYDPNGNATQKMDARGISTRYSYDGLNRLLSKTYSSDTTSTPWSCYQYDSTAVTYGIGRLANEWTQIPSAGPCAATLPGTVVLTKRSVLAYDSMGRVTSEAQCVGSACSQNVPGSPTYSYDLAGNLTTFGNLVGTSLFTNAYDSVGRLCLISTISGSSCSQDATPSSANLFLNATYAPHGGLSAVTYGTGLNLSRTYDPRLRITGEKDTGTVGGIPAVPGAVVIQITGGVQSK